MMVVLFVGALGTSLNAQAPAADVTVISLTQTDGQFDTQSLDLKPGKYQFKITNQSVGHDVGFVIQKEEDKDGDVMKTALKTSFAESMIAKGETKKSGIVELKEGNYVYSCPLNPTPKYSITVSK